MAAAVLLQPAVMPWYVLWPLPLAIAAGDRILWPAFTALALLSYLFYAEQVERSWWLWLEYGGLLALAAARWRRLGRRTGGAGGPAGDGGARNPSQGPA